MSMKLLGCLKKHKPIPRDYLYIDETRLNSYISQISTISTSQRSPTLKFGMSGTKPSISIDFSTQLREKTNHEKVCELVTYLEKSGHLSHERPAIIQESGDYVNVTDFILEECGASRILIPAEGNESGKPGIVIWISEWPLERHSDFLRPPGLLCIIQDSTHDDTIHTAGFSHSSYTWLQALLYQLGQEMVATKLSSEYPVPASGEYLFDIMRAQYYLRDDSDVFRPYPLEWLKQKGCILSENRRIEVLYRIRNLGGDEIGTQNNSEDFTVSTFAYAIAIWAASRSSFKG